jgi:hypothetical protein
MLNDVGAQTGGRLFRAGNIAGMGEIAEEVSTELRANMSSVTGPET